MKIKYIKVKNDRADLALDYAVESFEDDLRKSLLQTTDSGDSLITLEFRDDNSLDDEQYRIDISEAGIYIYGSSSLSFIYGLYYISETFLNVSPYYYFTEIASAPTEYIELPIGEIISKKRTFRFRGFFLNDEDLLVGWKMRSPYHGFNMDVMRNIFDMMLRCGCNCVIPGTNILPDEEQIKLASDMGLIISQHHAEPLGSAPLYWPRGVSFSWSTNKDDIINYWKKALTRQVGKRVLWTLNFRGLLDRPFWADDPSIDSNAPLTEKVKIINDVLKTQAELVKKYRPDNDLPFILNLWGEILTMYKQDLLEVPENTVVVFADAGLAVFENHPTTFMGNINIDINSAFTDSNRIVALPENDKDAYGIYQHVQMFDGLGSQRCNSLKPEIFHREFKKAIEKNMTEYIILNVGNIREHIFGIKQIVEYMNDFDSVKDRENDYFYLEFVKDTYGADQSDILASLYKEFYHLPFLFDENFTDYAIQDSYYANLIRYTLQQVYSRNEDAPNSFIGSFTKHSTLLEGIGILKEKFALDKPKWQALLVKLSEVSSTLSGSKKNYFDKEILYQTKYLNLLNSIAYHFSVSIENYLKKETYQSYLEAEQACLEYEQLLELRKELEYGKFVGWNKNDLNTRIEKNYKFLKGYLQMLDHLRWMNLPGDAEGPQLIYSAYHYNPNYKTAYRKDLTLYPEA